MHDGKTVRVGQLETTFNGGPDTTDREAAGHVRQAAYTAKSNAGWDTGRPAACTRTAGASIEGWDAISIAACIPHDHIWIGIAGCSKGIANRPFKATVQYTTLL
eukprot:1253012-Rhodomonas_salina.4